MDGQSTAGPLELGKRPTMRDVAAIAGVSLKTVSRVVNGEPGVSATLGQRVRAAIEELDFRPNVGASSLRRTGGRTSTVGLLLEDVSNPWSSTLQRAVEDVAIPRGVMVFSASLDEDPQRERELARAFSTRRADGLIIAPASDDQSYLLSEVRAGTVIVCVDREAGHLAVDSVLTTNQAGSTDGVRHLVEQGHRRIAFLGDRRAIATAQQRFDGYRAALGSAGLPVDETLVVHDLDTVRAADAAEALLALPDPPTALFAAQNLITIGVARALRRLGREHDVALVGFDDFPLADLLTPGITVVAQDPSEMGRLAATVLFDRITGDETGPPRTHVVPTTLLRRGSGEIRPPAR